MIRERPDIASSCPSSRAAAATSAADLHAYDAGRVAALLSCVIGSQESGLLRVTARPDAGGDRPAGRCLPETVNKALADFASAVGCAWKARAC